MQSATVDDYLARLPADRREAISRVRDVINAKLPRGFEEKMQYGMIAWCVPESFMPAKETYNKQPLCLAGLASQKNHMAVYLMSVYGDSKERRWFESAYKASGKKLDMGQSCVRFKSLDALPLDLIGEAISHASVDRYVATYKQVRDDLRAKRAPSTSANKAAAAKKTAAKKTAAKKTAAKRSPAKKPAKKTAAKRR